METNPNKSLILHLVRISHPLFILVGVLFYALGAGIAKYLGVIIDWQIYGVGQACVTLLQLSTQFLSVYFATLEPASPSRLPVIQGGDYPDERVLSRNTLLLIAAALLTSGAAFTVLIYRDGRLTVSTLIILGFAFAVSFFYSAPPVRLSKSGYGELTTAILMANLVPAFGFLLQTGSLHRLVAMSTFPLTALYLAMLLALSLPLYARDMKYGRRTLMVRLGWQRAMILHNYLVIFAYVLLLLAVLLGFPWLLAWPVFLTLPLGVFQIWQFYQISNGAKPHWPVVVLIARASLILAAYLIALSFWIG